MISMNHCPMSFGLELHESVAGHAYFHLVVNRTRQASAAVHVTSWYEASFVPQWPFLLVRDRDGALLDPPLVTARHEVLDVIKGHAADV